MHAATEEGAQAIGDGALSTSAKSRRAWLHQSAKGPRRQLEHKAQWYVQVAPMQAASFTSQNRPGGRASS